MDTITSSPGAQRLFTASIIANRAVEEVPLLMPGRPDTDLTRRARELAGFSGAALVCTGTDAASS